MKAFKPASLPSFPVLKISSFCVTFNVPSTFHSTPSHHLFYTTSQYQNNRNPYTTPITIMAAPKSKIPLFLGLTAAGGVGYYLYNAGGSPKVAEKQFESMLLSIPQSTCCKKCKCCLDVVLVAGRFASWPSLLTKKSQVIYPRHPQRSKASYQAEERKPRRRARSGLARLELRLIHS